VAELWSKQVHQKVNIEENCLRSSDSHSENYSWVSHGKENEEVHPLVLGFLEEMMDPSVVLLQCS